MKKAHLVFVPSPGASHLVSALEFAKLLINRDSRLRITILIIKLAQMGEADTETYTSTLTTSEKLRVINLPECTLPPTTSSDPGVFLNALLEAQKPNVKQAVSNLKEERVAAFVVDMFCTPMIDVAKELQLPALVFFTSGVAFLGLTLHLHTLREKHEVEATQLQDSLKDVRIPTFSNPVPLNSLPSMVRRKDYEPSFITYGRGLKKADGIIVNSFEELESHVVHSFSHTSALPIYPVGPILNLGEKGEHNDMMIIKWLDNQPPSSVIFLSFGSRGTFDLEQVTEIARAIENSRARFLWSLRKPAPKGSDEDMEHQEAIQSLGGPITRAMSRRVQESLVQFMTKTIASEGKDIIAPKTMLVIQAMEEAQLA